MNEMNRENAPHSGCKYNKSKVAKIPRHFLFFKSLALRYY